MLFGIDFIAQRRDSCCPKKCVILIHVEALDRHGDDLLVARRNGRECFGFGCTLTAVPLYLNYGKEAILRCHVDYPCIVFPPCPNQYVMKLFVYSDSCSRQNRNNFVLAFWVHRILKGKHDKSFLVVGHTKFTPDQLFGLMLHIAEKYITM